MSIMDDLMKNGLLGMMGGQGQGGGMGGMGLMSMLGQGGGGMGGGLMGLLGQQGKGQQPQGAQQQIPPGLLEFLMNQKSGVGGLMGR